MVYIINLFTFAMYLIFKFLIMELQPSDSLKLIQAIIEQRKQKYEENGFFLIFWSVLIIAAGVLQFAMLTLNYYPNYSWMGWVILMPLGFVFSFFTKMKEGIKSRKEKKISDSLDWLWLVSGLGATIPYTSWEDYRIAILIIYLPFSFVALAIALHLRISIWIVSSLIGIVLIYSTLFVHYEKYTLPLLSSILACLLFLVPGIRFYSDYKRQRNVQ